MDGIRPALWTSFFYYYFKINSNEVEFEEEFLKGRNTVIRGLFQTISVGIVSSMVDRSLKASGCQKNVIPVLAACTMTPLILSTAEALVSNEKTRRSFRSVRDGVRTFTEYANIISSISLIILRQPILGVFMIPAGWLSTKEINE